jgi:hypothetical protein
MLEYQLAAGKDFPIEFVKQHKVLPLLLLQ